ncbi:MAG: calcium/sodium antiporter [Planctomycetota bacterium]
MQDWLQIAIGFVCLIGAAELLVRGSVYWALGLGISPLVVGLTMVAFGTSAPELMVGVQGTMDGDPEIATGSVLGSNIANIGLIMGIVALCRPVQQPAGGTRFELSFLVATSAFVTLGALAAHSIGRIEGALLVVSIIAFTLLLYRRSVQGKQRGEASLAVDTEKVEVRPGPAILNTLFIAAGLLGLKYGGQTLVDGAKAIASNYGLSKALVSETIVAIGTSLPELATSIVAARKGQPELALGNVLGSNVFNISLVLGVSALFAPLPLHPGQEGLSSVVGLVLALLLATFLSKGRLPRMGGAVLLAIYVAYIGWRVANA